MKKQVVVRTWPNGYTNATTKLREHLANGYCVVMCNQFNVGDGIVGNEYILEKEVKDE